MKTSRGDNIAEKILNWDKEDINSSLDSIITRCTILITSLKILGAQYPHKIKMMLSLSILIRSSVSYRN